MDALTRVTQQAEKPGRLHLAILEWQRQLIAREGSERVLRRLDSPSTETR
jgi:uncharacterized protein YigA (DUF484 family)